MENTNDNKLIDRTFLVAACSQKAGAINQLQLLHHLYQYAKSVAHCE